MKRTLSMLLAATCCALALPAYAQSGTYTVRQLTPETAAKAVRAALDECRKRGYQVAAAVVDRGGVAQALMRIHRAPPLHAE